jgi:hypothetical protein
MIYLQGECSYIRAEEEEEDIQRRWSGYFQDPLCLIPVGVHHELVLA